MKLIIQTILIFGWLLFLTVPSNAQTRGYLGKRFTFEMNLNNGYSRTTKINANYSQNNSEQKKERRYNIYPEFTLAYTIGRRIDIGFLHSRDVVPVQLSELAFKFEGSTNFYNPNLEPSDENSSLNDYLFTPNKKYNVGTSRMYQLFFRFYTKRSIAPVGFYHQIALGFNTLDFKNSIEGELKVYSAINLEDIILPLELKINKYNISKFSYFIGNKKVFTNGLYINSGVGFNVPLNRTLALLDRSGNSWNYNYKYISQLNTEITFAQLIEFKFGLGFIF